LLLLFVIVVTPVLVLVVVVVVVAELSWLLFVVDYPCGFVSCQRPQPATVCTLFKPLPPATKPK